MSFDVNFLSRDHLLDSARPMTAREIEGTLGALRLVIPDFDATALEDEYQVEARDGGGIDLLTGAKDASALLIMRGLMQSHCVLVFEILRANDWVAVFADDGQKHTLIATAPVGAERGDHFAEDFGIGATVIVRSPQDVAIAMGAAFKDWQDWAGFDEAGRRKES